MTKHDGIYKCEVCGNVVSVIEPAAGILVCCGQDMRLLEEKTQEPEGNEKHIPVVDISDKEVKVKVGSVEHPMEDKHYIELIQLVKDEKVLVQRRLNPGEKPQAKFCLNNTKGITARILCNIHGVWKN